jgi:hypothetical protein
VAASSFAAEGAVTDWAAVYLRDVVGTTAEVAAAGFVAFAVGMTASRLLADRAVERWGPSAVVRVGGVAALAAVVAALAFPVAAVALPAFAVLGVALAPVVPVVFRAAAAGPGGHHHLGWVVTLAYAGSMTGPAVIGLGARLADLRTGLVVVVALALAVATLGARAARPDPLSRPRPPGTTSGN